MFPNRVWFIKTDEKVLYLTFDDGPHPEATLFVLEELKKFSAKATFFCIGKNVRENFSVYQKILDEGHTVGNHSFSHLNGWKTPDDIYFNDIAKAKKIIDSNFFRPPYGRITNFQAKVIAGDQLQLKTIMWDVLSGDFDKSVNGENCYLNVVNNAEAGSIIVFHDSLKSLQTLQFALSKILEFYSEKGFRFESLKENFFLKKIGPE